MMEQLEDVQSALFASKWDGGDRHSKAAEALDVMPSIIKQVQELEQQIETWRVEHRVKTAYKLFYGDGLSLGEVAEQLHCSIYDLSPWLTASAIRIALDSVSRTPAPEAR